MWTVGITVERRKRKHFGNVIIYAVLDLPLVFNCAICSFCSHVTLCPCLPGSPASPFTPLWPWKQAEGRGQTWGQTCVQRQHRRYVASGHLHARETRMSRGPRWTGVGTLDNSRCSDYVCTSSMCWNCCLYCGRTLPGQNCPASQLHPGDKIHVILQLTSITHLLMWDVCTTYSGSHRSTGSLWPSHAHRPLKSRTQVREWLDDVQFYHPEFAWIIKLSFKPSVFTVIICFYFSLILANRCLFVFLGGGLQTIFNLNKMCSLLIMSACFQWL